MRNKRKKVPVSRSGLFFTANGMFPKDNSKAVIESAYDIPVLPNNVAPDCWISEDTGEDYSEDTDILFFHHHTTRCSSIARTDLVLEIAHSAPLGNTSSAPDPVFFNYDYGFDNSGLF